MIELPEDEYFPIYHMREPLERYVNQGIPPGGFLTAVLQNNLVEAFARADATNKRNMSNIVGYVYHHVPMGAWGSPEKVEEWIEKHKVARIYDL